jgi:2-polyprenyl-3-methyl-5-hydroxy-6-metoxy-1,4-benzoquinol methylase
MLVQARAGFSGVAHFDFCSVAEMEQKAPLGAFDLACCTETLEHVRNPGEILDQLIARLRPGGLLLVSVPIEIGPALLIKQAGRFVANRKRTYGYETYTLGELVLAGVLRDTESFPNSHNGGEGLGNPMTGHRGFDFRKVEKLVRDRAEVERTLFSPVPMLGPAFNSTVLWLARRGSCP